MKLKMFIQMHEQQINDIDKAQAGTVYKPSGALGRTAGEPPETPAKQFWPVIKCITNHTQSYKGTQQAILLT